MVLEGEIKALQLEQSKKEMAIDALREKSVMDDAATVNSSEDSNGSLGVSSNHSRNAPRPRLRRMRKIKSIAAPASPTPRPRRTLFGGGRRSTLTMVDIKDDDPEEEAPRHQTGPELLEEIRNALATERSNERKIRNGIRVHKDRAKARFVSGTSVGAAVSMRKIHKLEEERENALSAIRYLNKLAHDLNGRLQADAHSPLTAAEVTRYSSFAAEVDAIYAGGDDAGAAGNENATDDELLSELAHVSANWSSLSSLRVDSIASLHVE